MGFVALSFFQSSMVLIVPLLVAVVFALLMIPSLLVEGAKPEEVARAISATLAQAFGLILLSLSAIRLVYGLVAMQMPTGNVLSVLVLILVIGIGIMIHESRRLANLDPAATTVSRMVLLHTCELIGALFSLIAALSLSITFMMTREFTGWETSCTMLLLGVTLMYASSVHIERKHKTGKKKKR